MNSIRIFLIIFIISLFSCKNKTKFAVKQHKDANGFSYETVENDPTGLRLYTLENGLKVYMSRNTDEPKIQTFIAVKAGSNYDPKESTGLAHYLEHMLFKGTSKIGAENWVEEKKLLQKISNLYEKQKNETDPKKKKLIYREIDKISLKASNYCIANEYDKMVGSLGASGTNAHTWFEETIYKNKIPANELEKWIELEYERFSELVLRLFHTELEVVYEEFNRIQDNDRRKRYYAMLDGLFPNHPYGQQTTIGKSEHLKNPSMVAIHNYFKKYYVPNNMAMVLVGDFDFDSTIEKVNETFGKMEKKELTHPTLPKEEPIAKPIFREVFGPTAESIVIAFRSKGINTQEEKLLTMADMILANGTAGLIDLNLNQKQIVQRASCYPTFLNDYGYHVFTGTPKQNQSLDEVKEILFGELEKLKKGEFEDWMLSAVINDLKLNQTNSYENSSPLAAAYYDAFIHNINWKDKVAFIDNLRKITKQDVIDFANEFYKNNYVVVYKRQGKDDKIVKVENPGITPIKLNRGKQSDYLKAFNKKTVERIKPLFVDYNKKIKIDKLSNGLDFQYIVNEKNDLFSLNFIFDMGGNHNKKLAYALGYVNYLGTQKYSPEELKQEFYKLGINYGVSVGSDKSYVYISGIKDNLHKGLELLEDLWENVVPDQTAYDKYVDKILKNRIDAKGNKRYILRNGLVNYAKYGEKSPLRNIFNAEELRKLTPSELVTILKDLRNYKQRIFYYGKDITDVKKSLDELHKLPNDLKNYPTPTKYTEKNTGRKVYFVDFDMVQTEIIFLAKGENFDAQKLALSRVFNNYFGSGFSSIVFQEIRESKSLAYSAYSAYLNASKKEKPNYVFAYIGTQANKLPQAVDAMLKLMNKMPENKRQFEIAKESVLKKIAAERINKANIFWRFESLKQRGIDYDIRKDLYETIPNFQLEDLSKFFNNNIKGSKYTVLVIGNKKDMNMSALRKLGTVKELDIEYLFNY